ncbi:unnamed protein product [Arctogadus glacialis]
MFEGPDYIGGPLPRDPQLQDPPWDGTLNPNHPGQQQPAEAAGSPSRLGRGDGLEGGTGGVGRMERRFGRRSGTGRQSGETVWEEERDGSTEGCDAFSTYLHLGPLRPSSSFRARWWLQRQVWAEGGVACVSAVALFGGLLSISGRDAGSGCQVRVRPLLAQITAEQMKEDLMLFLLHEGRTLPTTATFGSVCAGGDCQ